MRLVGRLAVQADDGLWQRTPIMGVDALCHLKHAVERRLEAAGEFSHHHVGEAAVAAEDGRRAFVWSKNWNGGRTCRS